MGLISALPLLLVASFLQATPTLSTDYKKITSSYFCPHEGEAAFTKTYNYIGNAKTYVKVTVYSWSDKDFGKALEKAAANGAQVRVMLHPPLYNDSEKVKTWVSELEQKGVEFKIAIRNMHEKFSIIDDQILINTSANFSNGARNNYSENFVIMDPVPEHLLNQFKREFAILWDSGTDVITNDEPIATAEGATDLDFNRDDNMSVNLYSSSENWKIKSNKPDSEAYNKGRYITLSPIKDEQDEQTWVVRDMILNAINNSEKSVHCALNHFNIEDIALAMIDAVKDRGVDVELAVDNQEFKPKHYSKDIEMTPLFVQKWQKLPGNENEVPPVRVKYYSHSPNPRFWYLNHHKYCLIDYNPEKPSDSAILISGSYNLSRTAEQNQFDNMMVFKGKDLDAIQKEFNDEFTNLWNWNRTSNDEPNWDQISQYTTPDSGFLPVHFKDSFSLTWPEIFDLRERIETSAPGFFSKLYKQCGREQTCIKYDVEKGQFVTAGD